MPDIRGLLVAGFLMLTPGAAIAQEEARDPASPWDVHPAMIGSTIPKATLLTSEGIDFDLNRSVAAMPTILIFYRGGW